MSATHAVEVHPIDGSSLAFGEITEPEDLEVVPLFCVEVFVSAEPQLWMLLNKGLDGLRESCPISRFRYLLLLAFSSMSPMFRVNI